MNFFLALGLGRWLHCNCGGQIRGSRRAYSDGQAKVHKAGKMKSVILSQLCNLPAHICARSAAAVYKCLYKSQQHTSKNV